MRFLPFLLAIAAFARTPLIDAARNSDKDAIRSLIQKKADVNAADADERRAGEGGEIVKGLRDGIGTGAELAVEQGDAEVWSEQAQLGPETSHCRTGADEALGIYARFGRNLCAYGTELRDGERLCQ